jgi:hypothetical protein
VRDIQNTLLLADETMAADAVCDTDTKAEAARLVQELKALLGTEQGAIFPAV